MCILQRLYFLCEANQEHKAPQGRYCLRVNKRLTEYMGSGLFDNIPLTITCIKCRSKSKQCSLEYKRAAKRTSEVSNDPPKQASNYVHMLMKISGIAKDKMFNFDGCFSRWRYNSLCRLCLATVGFKRDRRVVCLPWSYILLIETNRISKQTRVNRYQVYIPSAT